MGSRTLFCAIGSAIVAFCLAYDPAGAATDGTEAGTHAMTHGMMQGMEAGPPVSFAALETTVENLERARSATEKYQDVGTAEADGYHAMGPYIPGMGFHYVKAGRSRAVDIEHPPILLYEKDAAAPQGLRLVGVSYLLDAPKGSDGQPTENPFPPALASWHKHQNICVLPDRSTDMHLAATQCQERGGRFIPETPWMVHAWIWKDSPAGVFSPMNPEVH